MLCLGGAVVDGLKRASGDRLISLSRGQKLSKDLMFEDARARREHGARPKTWHAAGTDSTLQASTSSRGETTTSPEELLLDPKHPKSFFAMLLAALTSENAHKMN